MAFWTHLMSYLPPSDGLLPRWQLFAALLAMFNTAQNFATLKLTRRLYNNVPPTSVTPLHVRTFAAWTLTVAMVRVYAAYRIHDKSIYDMTLLTYLIAFGHFTSELLIYRTTKINPGTISTLSVASISLIWMYRQYEFYVQR